MRSAPFLALAFILAGCTTGDGAVQAMPSGILLPVIGHPTLDGAFTPDEWDGALTYESIFRIPPGTDASGDFPFTLKLGASADSVFVGLLVHGLEPNPNRSPTDPSSQYPDQAYVLLAPTEGDIETASDSFSLGFAGRCPTSCAIASDEGYWDASSRRWLVQDQRAHVVGATGEQELASRGRAFPDANGTTFEFRIHRSAKVPEWDSLDLSRPGDYRMLIKLERQYYRPGEEDGSVPSGYPIDLYSDTWPGEGQSRKDDDPSTWLRIQLS